MNSKVAVAKLEELRKVKPDYPVEATAAEIMLNDGKYQEALAWYGKANPAYMTEDNFYNYGFAAYITKDYLQKFQNSEYLSRIAMMASVELKDYASAVNYGKAVFAGTGKKVANDYDVYAKALCGAQQYDEAVSYVNKALEADKKSVEPLKTLAAIYSAQGNEKNAVLAKALAVYDQMIEKFPSISDWVWLNQANVAQLMNDPDKVAEIYQKVAAFEEAKPNLDADSKSYLESVYYGLGYYYSKKGNKELADQYFKKVLDVNPDNEGAKKALGL